MKESTKDFLIKWIILFVFVGVIVSVFGWIMYSDSQDRGLCRESLDVSADDGITYFYRFVDEDHFNCCWNKVELNDEGYYTTEQCRGFKR